MYLIGRVVKPHGVKGEIKVDPVSPSLERFYQLDKIHLISKDYKETHCIEKTRIADRFIIFKLRGIENRNDAELLRGAEVFIEEKDLIQPSDNEFFIHDLIGCRVITDEGQELGILEDVLQLSSNDVYVVKTGNKEELLIPAIKEVINQVDIARQLITIHLIEGMLD